MNRLPDPEPTHDERRCHGRVQDAVGLYLRRPGEAVGETRVVSANDAPEVADGDCPDYRLVFEHIGDADRDALAEHIATLADARPDTDD